MPMVYLVWGDKSSLYIVPLSGHIPGPSNNLAGIVGTSYGSSLDLSVSRLSFCASDHVLRIFAVSIWIRSSDGVYGAVSLVMGSSFWQWRQALVQP